MTEDSFLTYRMVARLYVLPGMYNTKQRKIEPTCSSFGHSLTQVTQLTELKGPDHGVPRLNSLSPNCFLYRTGFGDLSHLSYTYENFVISNKLTETFGRE